MKDSLSPNEARRLALGAQGFGEGLGPVPVERRHLLRLVDRLALHHRAIHATVSNKELARTYPTLAALRAREDVRAFLGWIANKPPDFHAPTRRRRG